MIKISFNGVDGYSKDPDKALRRDLEARGLWGERFLYHSIRPANLRRLSRTGSPYRDDSFVCCCSDFVDDVICDGNISESLLYYLTMHWENEECDHAVFAVFHRAMLDLTQCANGWHFRAQSKREALAAVVRIEYFFREEKNSRSVANLIATLYQLNLPLQSQGPAQIRIR